jgi:hypothetical protein
MGFLVAGEEEDEDEEIKHRTSNAEVPRFSFAPAGA